MALEIIRPRTYAATLTAARDLAHETRGYVFALPAGETMPLKAGQFVMLHAPQADGTPEKRAYSVVNVPALGDTTVNEVELCVKLLEGGAVSTYLAGLAVGADVAIEGPFGRFGLKPWLGPRIFVATGTGIAPFMSMLVEALHEPESSVIVLAGYRSPADVLYAEELDVRAAASGGRMRVLTTLSRPGPQWHGLAGRVTEHLPGLLSAYPNAQVYLCGNPRMVDDAKALLMDVGLGPERIVLEKFTTVGKTRAGRTT